MLLRSLLFILCIIAVSSAQELFLSPPDSASASFQTIERRFPAPEGFKRMPAAENSFAAWLRRVPLLPPGQPVHDYRHHVFKQANDTTVAAVTAYNIRGRKLEQCMDIILRWRAEYLWQNGRQKDIRFPLPEGTDFSWSDWLQGLRPRFRGARFHLYKGAKPDSSYNNLLRYLNTLFEYSGTQAFYHYYRKVDPASVQPGDFVVKKGKKGHAVLIVDMAQDSLGNKIALIGQGDTPACQFYLMHYKKNNPWFPLNAAQKCLPLPIKKKMYWEGLRRFADR